MSNHSWKPKAPYTTPPKTIWSYVADFAVPALMVLSLAAIVAGALRQYFIGG